MKNCLCFCLTGWHFQEDMYAQLRDIPGADIFVVSHKAVSVVPSFVHEYVKDEHVFYEPNVGYDWGCYQQFVAKDIWLDYDVIFFMHDDLIIKDADFVQRAIALLGDGASVVGNGKNSNKLNWPETHLFCYAHSQWIPPSVSFRHDTVRGSFFVTTSSALKRIRQFEVFWDGYHISVRYGNHSLISTCGKFQYIFGEGSFAFLGNDYLNSPYITELERGGDGRKTSTVMQRIVVALYNKIAKLYVLQRMNKMDKNMAVWIFPMKALRTIVSFVSGDKTTR